MTQQISGRAPSGRDVIPMSQWPSGHEYVIPVAPGPEIVTVTIDGKEVQAPRGELLIRVAQDHGTFVPRFCWHERMKPVGMCRMCLVEVEGMRGLQISCATPVVDGMVVHTTTDTVKTAQDGVLEFLLINHPLDCPVCDRGGECPLQDQTLAFGPGESRFVEEKRHFAKPIPISDLVLLDRERCIQCGRCTRFADEIAGDPLIDFGGRSGNTEVITFPGKPFSSYFSGNTVQICPVGALTATPYRFVARPWDLDSVETSCQSCSVGCRVSLESTSNRLVRLLGVDSEPVNQGWLCDLGRFGYEWVQADARWASPMVRRRDRLVETSWPEALDVAATALRRVRDEHGSDAIAVLGGARGTNEDAYAWARLAKGVLGTDNVDAQLGDGLSADLVLGMPRATIADLDRARTIVALGPDLEEELPVLYLRVRGAVDNGVPLIDIAAREHGLTSRASWVLRHAPGDAADAVRKCVSALGAKAARTQAAQAMEKAVVGRDGPVVVVLGRASVAESAQSTVYAASLLAALPDVRFLSALPGGNVHGALDLGLAPGFLPGRVSLDTGREHFRDAWGRVPEAPGLDATASLQAAVDGTIKALVLLGCDPLSEVPDRGLVKAALANVDRVIAVGAFPPKGEEGDGAGRVDVVLPVTVWGEHEGSITNLEGRVQRLGRKVSPESAVMEAWRIAGELASRLGDDFDLESIDEVQDEIARVAPAFAGVDATLLRRARDGVVLPLAEHAAEIEFGSGRVGAGLSWEPIPPNPAERAVLEVDEEEPGADDRASEAIELVPLHRWSGTASAPPSAPIDAYALRLVAGRTLYGADRIVVSSATLAGLAPGARLLVNPRDRDRIGVADGVRVRVASSRGAVELPVHADPTLPIGVAFIAHNQAGPGAADLIDTNETVTDLRVETIA